MLPEMITPFKRGFAGGPEFKRMATPDIVTYPAIRYPYAKS